jgi:predicted RNA binding protein YcfA (HicA-like mRNA interferase family)
VGQKDLPLAAGEEHVRAFERLGWTRRSSARGKKGNHTLLTKPGFTVTLSIPSHSQVKRTLIQKQIRLAQVTEAQYLEAFYA